MSAESSADRSEANPYGDDGAVEATAEPHTEGAAAGTARNGGLHDGDTQGRVASSTNSPVPPTDQAGGGGRSPAMWLLALVPGIIVAIASAVVALGAGKPEWFGSVDLYRAVLNAAVLLRMFGMFIAVVLVWWELRTRGAPRGVLLLAVVSGPAVYAVLAFFTSLSFFPPAESAYYMLNPLAVASLGSQVGFASLVEILWRGAGRRRGRWDGRVLSGGVLAGLIGGFAVLYLAVLHAGGTTGFFLFSAGYRLLFT